MSILMNKKNEVKAILEKAKTENRSVSADETKTLETLKAEIEAIESEIKSAKEDNETHLRSVTAAQTFIKDSLSNVDKNTYFRSIAKGANDVGNKEVLDDVVRQFETQSPIFRAHKNVQKRSTGMAYSYIKVVSLGTGAAKTEGQAGTTDSSSTIEPASIVFKTYSGQLIPVTQEMLDDCAADVAKEVITLGSSQAIHAFDKDAVEILEAYFAASNEPTETATTSWAISDLVKAYFLLPERNRYDVKFICDAETAANLIDLMDAEDTAKTAAIGLVVDNLIIDSNVNSGWVIICNPTLALGIGMKEPVRVFVQETSAGKSFEVQPRMAVVLRDETAVTAVQLKS